MTDLEMADFERRLEQRLRHYAAVQPRPFDAREIARSTVIARGGTHSWLSRWSLPTLRPSLLLLLLALLALTAAAYVGARLLLTDTPRPYRDLLVPLGPMAMARVSPITVTLEDGRVLIAGGVDGTLGGVPAEVLDPTTGETVAVHGSTPVGVGTGVRLRDGRVLVIAFSGNMTSSFAHIFDPETMEFSLLEQEGFSNAPPFGVTPSLALLDDGRVLVAGGRNDVYQTSVRRAAVLFDPEAGKFTPTGEMINQRIGHAMVTLADGRVLVVGGFEAVNRPGLTSTEIYDPATGQFSPGPEAVDPMGPAAALLMPDGSVLAMPVTGEPAAVGQFAAGSGPTRWVRFDLDAGRLAAGGFGLARPSALALLRDGSILITGVTFKEPTFVDGPASYFDAYEPWAWLFDPDRQALLQAAAPTAREFGDTTLLDGRVLFAGGISFPPLDDNESATGEGQPTDRVEVYE